MFVSSSELGYKMGLCRWAHSFNSIFTLAANGVMGLTSVKAPGFGDERGVEAGGLSGGRTGRWAGSPRGSPPFGGRVCKSTHFLGHESWTVDCWEPAFFPDVFIEIIQGIEWEKVCEP